MPSMEASNSLSLSIDAFVRSVQVNQASPHAFFLGAGASISSQVPSAGSCIWEWKRKIFLTKNVGLEQQFQDITLPSIQERIQRWLDNQPNQYPRLNSPNEYSTFVELCYPIEDDRRQYFQNLVSGVQPNIGYQLLCLLAEAGIVKATWTTNFDSLVSKSATSFNITPIEIGLDNSDRTLRRPRDGELLCVSIHGDYRYDSLKNTPDELANQNKILSNALIHYARDASFIVMGYSGRDTSVMETLYKSFTEKGTGRLYWCGNEELEPSSEVQELILAARRSGREAYYVSTNGFDDTLRRIALHSLTGDLLKRAQQIISIATIDTSLPPFEIPIANTRAILRSNLFPIICPSEILQFEATGYDIPGSWQRLREQTQDKQVVAGLLRGKVLALGTIDAIKATFDTQITSNIDRIPIDEKELSISDGVIVSLLTQAVIRSISEIYGLMNDGRHLIWSPTSLYNKVIHNVQCHVYPAASLGLRRYGGRQYLAITPTVKGLSLLREELDDDTKKELQREVLSKQWNKQFSDDLSYWQKILLPENENCYEFPIESGSTFRFSIFRKSCLIKISSSEQRNHISIHPAIGKMVAFEGFEIKEPALKFSNQHGVGSVTDTHPIRGIVNNQPYDFALTARKITQDIRIGVICPRPDASQLSDYLNQVHQAKPKGWKPEYLLDYPGFAQAFGATLSIPLPQNDSWIECPEPKLGMGVREGAAQLTQFITSSINALYAATSPSVIVVFIPERWQHWEKYSIDGVNFDLHDFIKAYCVPKGIATQVLRQATLTKNQQGEVTWWLALSFYAKSMRTPWVLDGFDEETAFIGIGYSQDSSAERGQQIILGCSHIYSSSGLGLRYRLGKIDSPIFDRQGNPFMSFDDARRLETV